MPSASCLAVHCPSPPAPRCSRYQGKSCKLRWKVGNTFWPRPKPDCAASELIAHMQTDGETDRETDTHTLSLSLLPPSPSFSLALLLLHAFIFIYSTCLSTHFAPARRLPLPLPLPPLHAPNALSQIALLGNVFAPFSSLPRHRRCRNRKALKPHFQTNNTRIPL